MSELLDVAAIYDGALAKFSGEHSTLTEGARATIIAARDAARRTETLLQENTTLLARAVEMIEPPTVLQQRLADASASTPIPPEQWFVLKENEERAQQDYDRSEGEDKHRAALVLHIARQNREHADLMDKYIREREAENVQLQYMNWNMPAIALAVGIYTLLEQIVPDAILRRLQQEQLRAEAFAELTAWREALRQPGVQKVEGVVIEAAKFVTDKVGALFTLLEWRRKFEARDFSTPEDLQALIEFAPFVETAQFTLQAAHAFIQNQIARCEEIRAHMLTAADVAPPASSV